MTSLSAAFSFPVKVEKKRILLIATYATKRDLRARVLRKLGVEVDCAADIGEARSLWRVDTYDLVLVDVIQHLGHLRCALSPGPQRLHSGMAGGLRQ